MCTSKTQDEFALQIQVGGGGPSFPYATATAIRDHLHGLDAIRYDTDPPDDSVVASVGASSLPLIGAGSSYTVLVALHPAQPSAEYEAVATVIGSGGLLGGQLAVEVVDQSAGTVSVHVTNTDVLAPILAGQATVAVAAAGIG
ncbi:hypothetical protein [Alloactinosynnema sp. L-07]|uniref:hypothetical protein n=1 Tax=Alloactinosynnema sp. L-07 TaxID=1653480 RepID=UPI00065F0AAA|nr:hypothetical protein [Alloactinosynnema sp. L-07]CRK59083.1 hypothetical protein [Alloactinosynnema sp. L-07]